ncbi:hypothetical protein CPJCM30710_15010 [Clostridium polyendosporum]|uniref:DUF4007 domain-containing protein n=1 Tax=Clostridium polyendosporum TaxID=69208 RepID=A0A919RYF7_9CLOT|nr:DUF4007 family protein [Clostridium polyendosporum]GIM28835.1 hypothetical protein CPJCM30710_15010 [Clostridium polyendosporum]
MAVKIRLKGHESFNIREGWLRKGISVVYEKNMPYIDNEDAKDVFSEDDAVDTLGVGSNMVKSIKYWLQACGLIDDRRTKKGRRLSILSSGFGDIVNKNDPYFEEMFTLWLIHYKLVTNLENATSWYLFFNDFKVNEFSRHDLYNGLELGLSRLDLNLKYSERSLHDDCVCIVKTYSTNTEDLKNPEENLCCPLAELGLLNRKVNLDKKEVFIKKKPRVDILDPRVVLYVIVDRLNGEANTTIDKLLNENCNIGKVFNLDTSLINYYLDELERRGYLTVNRTAGLDTIYLKKEINCIDLMNEYYQNS